MAKKAFSSFCSIRWRYFEQPVQSSEISKKVFIATFVQNDYSGIIILEKSSKKIFSEISEDYTGGCSKYLQRIEQKLDSSSPNLFGLKIDVLLTFNCILSNYDCARAIFLPGPVTENIFGY